MKRAATSCRKPWVTASNYQLHSVQPKLNSHAFSFIDDHCSPWHIHYMLRHWYCPLSRSTSLVDSSLPISRFNLVFILVSDQFSVCLVLPIQHMPTSFDHYRTQIKTHSSKTSMWIKVAPLAVPGNRRKFLIRMRTVNQNQLRREFNWLLNGRGKAIGKSTKIGCVMRMAGSMPKPRPTPHLARQRKTIACSVANVWYGNESKAKLVCRSNRP